MLDENGANREDRALNLSDPTLIERYFSYYFFDRRNEMEYPVGPTRRNETILC